MVSKSDMSTDYIASHVPPQAGQISANIKISFGLQANLTLSGQTPIVLMEALSDHPVDKLGLILHSSQLLVLGDRGSRGEKVIDTTLVFWDLIRFAVENGPEALHNELPKDGRFFEQLIAGVYSEMGAKIVDLSPRSGDGGVDVWAVYELPGAGDVTIMDQVKLYRPDRVINPGDILRILGGEQRGNRFSKAVVSTTGKFSAVDRKEVEGFGERVTLRDAEVLKSVFEEALHHKDK